MALQMSSGPVSHQDQSLDLWQKAFNSLDDELKASLNFGNSSKYDILRRTLETAEQKKQLCLSKRWKFERHGKQVIVRDVLQKVIKWLDYFKATGDAAMQYDPVHAALPWAGVRFLLQVRSQIEYPPRAC